MTIDTRHDGKDLVWVKCGYCKGFGYSVTDPDACGPCSGRGGWHDPAPAAAFTPAEPPPQETEIMRAPTTEAETVADPRGLDRGDCDCQPRSEWPESFPRVCDEDCASRRPAELSGQRQRTTD